MASEKSAVGEEFFRLADEKAGNNLLHRLTGAKKADVLGLLKHTSGEFNQTIVMITHNNEIAQLADRIVRIEEMCIRDRLERASMEIQ